MSFFDKLKETAVQVTAAASVAVNKAAVAGKAAADTAVKQTKTAASIGKVKLAIASEEEKLKKAYTELGRLFYRDYEVQSETELEEYLPWIDKCAEAKAQIAALNEELEALRAEASKKEEVVVEETVEAESEPEDTSIFVDLDEAEDAEVAEEAAPVEDLAECVEFQVVDAPAEEPAVEEAPIVEEAPAVEAPTVGTLYVDVTGQE